MSYRKSHAMIEVVLADACISCGKCALVCPNDVFDGESGDIPVIARQDDCVTCYLCEAYCPVDALYVSPIPAPDSSVDIDAIRAGGLLGSFRRSLGWDKRPPGATPEAPPAGAFPAMFRGAPGGLGDAHRISSYGPGGVNADHAHSSFAEAHPDFTDLLPKN